MYMFKLKLSEKARGYCMYVFLVRLFIQFDKTNMIEICIFTQQT